MRRALGPALIGAWFSLSLAFSGCGDDGMAGPQFASHCSDAQGDATCQTTYPGRPWCSTCVGVDDHRGCVSSPPPPACRAEGSTWPTSGNETGNDPSTSSESGSGSETAVVDSSSGASSSGPGPLCSGAAGTVDADCEAIDPARPYCMDGACVSCEEAGGHDFCGAADAALPACDAEAGRCVACHATVETVCTGSTPVCGDGGSCVPCSEHADCPGTACHLAPSDPQVGSCFEASEVVWVDADQVCPGQGTQASPNCSLAQALDGIAEGESAVLIVDGNGSPYAEDAIASGDITVAIIGVGAPLVSGNPSSNQPSLSIESGASVYLHGVRVADNQATHGITCADGLLWMGDSEARNNVGYGIYTTSPCEITVRRANVHNNAQGGIRQFGGRLRLDNAAVSVNGTGGQGPGVNLQFAEIDAVYATIVGNNGVGPDSIHCLNATGSVRNSAIVGFALASVDLDCFSLDFEHNAIDTNGFVSGGVLVTNPYNANWFVAPATGDFRLSAPPLTPFGGAAMWEPGDPPVDADGTPRPMGLPGYAGVDEPDP